MGYIYKITNDINDKVYVGQTTRTLKARWQDHAGRVSCKDKNMHISNAIRKYGKEHFKIEIVEKCESDKLDEREIYWIEFYDSYNNGYNSTIGGKGGSKYDHDTFISLWNEGCNLKEISKMCQCSVETVRSHIYTIDGVQEELVSKKYIDMGSVISQYSLIGEYIKTYPTIQDASREMGFAKSTLSSSLSSGHSVCGGYQWRYGDSQKNIGMAKGHRKAIVKLTKGGEYICTYVSLMDAEKDTGVNHSNISKGCRKGYCYGGFKWIYYDDWEIKPIEES